MTNKFFSAKTVGAVFSVFTALSLVAGSAWAHEFPKAGPEHAWLQQLVGEWEAKNEAVMGPDQDPIQSTGTESIRSLGEFWTITDVKGTMMDTPFNGQMTLGYDTEKQKYVGTWVDSMTGNLWNYEGTLDEGGKILTLESEGKCPMNPGRVTRFREVVEMKSPDHKVFTSFMQDEKGEWLQVMTSEARRKQ
jgi:hypothetical protein